MWLVVYMVSRNEKPLSIPMELFLLYCWYHLYFLKHFVDALFSMFSYCEKCQISVSSRMQNISEAQDTLSHKNSDTERSSLSLIRTLWQFSYYSAEVHTCGFTVGGELKRVFMLSYSTSYCEITAVDLSSPGTEQQDPMLFTFYLWPSCRLCPQSDKCCGQDLTPSSN